MNTQRLLNILVSAAAIKILRSTLINSKIAISSLFYVTDVISVHPTTYATYLLTAVLINPTACLLTANRIKSSIKQMKNQNNESACDRGRRPLRTRINNARVE